ncbi:hypothetical protein AURDEDRAFT_98234 [Auricularia subglabra TFB-10046 SS5]|nr:hypothetical protein AURDEDRAFT_98234 [Auricularia subglabra TFB-10046 SS5]
MAFYEEMVATGVPARADTFAHLLRAAQNSDDRSVDYILDLIRQAGVPTDMGIFHELIIRHAKRGELEMCIQRLDDMLAWEISPSLESVEAITVLASEKGNARLAYEVAQSFEESSTRRLGAKTWVNILIASAQSLYRQGTEGAWEKVINEHKIMPDEGACIAVLHCAARHGLPQLAGDVIAQLFSAGVKPEEHHFAALVEAFAASGTLLEALAALSWMRSHKVPPTAHTAAPILERISADIDKTDDAFNLLYDLHADGRVVDIVAMNCVVEAAAKQGDLGRAVGIYKSAGDWDLAPDTSTFNILLDGCRAHGQVELPERILAEMQERGVRPDARTFETLIRIALIPDQYEDAFFYLSEMEKAKMVPAQEVYEAVVRKCVVHHDSRYTLAVQEMKQHGYEVTPTLQTFIDTKGKAPVKREPPPRAHTLLDYQR